MNDIINKIINREVTRYTSQVQPTQEEKLKRILVEVIREIRVFQKNNVIPTNIINGDLRMKIRMEIYYKLTRIDRTLN